uniref:T9SS type A sorting domain-containing protein n=1 Tax=Maribellus sediminis TaxID=2696285 RepID=UPI00143166EE
LEVQSYVHNGSDQTAPSLTTTPFTDATEYDACMADAQSTVPEWTEANAITGYSDNCGQAVSASLDSTRTTGDDCDWTVTYYYTVFDECLNPLEVQSYVHNGSDQTAPSLTTTPFTDATEYDACMTDAQSTVPEWTVANAITGYSDNCGQAVSASLDSTRTTGDDCDWTVTYYYTVFDECLNPLEVQSYVHNGGDKTAPTGSEPSDVTGINDCQPTQTEAEAEFDAVTVALNYSDNCGGDVIVILSSAIVSGNDCNWTVAYTYEVQDVCGNALTDQGYSVSGGDETDPTVVTQDIDVWIGSDGTVSITVDQIDNGSSDNCDPDPAMELDKTEFTCNDIGENTVTLKVTDECGNWAEGTATVTVYVPTTTVAKISAESARYMDDITFYAEVSSNCSTSEFGGNVIFYLDGDSVGTAPAFPIPLGEAGYPDTLRATLIHKIIEMPGDYELTAKFTPTTAYYDGSEGEVTPFEVVAREATPYNSLAGFYTGTILAWTTGPNSSTGTITLATVLKDTINNPTGDLRGAKVTFWMEDGNGNMKVVPSSKDLPVGLVEMTDGSIGVASADAQFDIGNYENQSFPVWVQVTGGYTNGFDPSNPGEAHAVVMVSKPVPGGSIAGMGSIDNVNSNGQIRGAVGKNTNFDFYVTYNKKKTNPQGKMTIFVTSWYKADGTLDNQLHFYKITSNAINLLVMGAGENYTGELGGADILSSGEAIFDAKANLSEKIGDTYVGVEGNSPLHVTMTDGAIGSKSIEGSIAITYFNSSGGIWFSSNYSLDENEITNEKDLTLGYIEVLANDDSSAGTTSRPSKTKSATIATSLEPMSVLEPGLKVYPNPFKDQVRFEFVSPVAAQAKIDIYNMAGQRIQTVFDGTVEENTTYNAEFIPETQVSGMYFYKMQLGDQVYNGKLVYKKD